MRRKKEAAPKESVNAGFGSDSLDKVIGDVSDLTYKNEANVVLESGDDDENWEW